MEAVQKCKRPKLQVAQRAEDVDASKEDKVATDVGAQEHTDDNTTLGRFYHCYPSRSTRILWALYECGADSVVDVVTLDMRKGDTQTPKYLAINPLGTVPCLELFPASSAALSPPQAFVSESAAIIHWLGAFAQQRQQRQQQPQQPQQQQQQYVGPPPATHIHEHAAYLQWIAFAASTLDPLLFTLFRSDEPAAGTGELVKYFDILEGVLGRTKYISGDSFRLADCIVAGELAFATDIGIELDEHRRLRDYLQLCRARPAYRKAYGLQGTTHTSDKTDPATT